MVMARDPAVASAVDPYAAAYEARGRLLQLQLIEKEGGVTSPRLDNTRERVLDAAIRLFADRGFEACTMRDLGSAVGIKAPALYNHFASKEVLLGEAVEHTLREFFTRVVGPLPSDPDGARLENVVRRYVFFQVEQREIARANDALLSTGTLRRLLPPEGWERIATALRSLVDILKALVRAEGTSVRDEFVTAVAITALCDRVSEWYRPEQRLGAEDIAEEVWLLVARMVGRSA
jgi:TetR/AcrR family transcriptional regulator, cholesterol catabolism regulator